ncbi:MAG: cation transporter [Phycisphaerales bacterium]|nr:cation transporter [Phycisphaerales bacterium]
MPDPVGPSADLSRGQRLSLLGLLTNSVLVGVKLAAGVLGNSYALIADAVESSLDILGSFVVWRGLRVAAKPADHDHPYGHGRAEQIAGIIVALMLASAAILIALGALREMASPHPPPAWYTLPVLLGVIAVKEMLARVVGQASRRMNSAALASDSWHHRSDAITSAAAAIGITVALVGGEPYSVADEAAALFASVIILINAWRLAQQPIAELMDVHPPHIAEQARAVAGTVRDVGTVEKVLGRKIGLRYVLDMHVEVDPDMTVRDSHRVAHEVKDAILAAMPSVQDVLVHIEPLGGVRQGGPS